MFASIANSSILRARITIPSLGIWQGDAGLDGDTAVTGDVSVVIGNLTLAGHAFRSAPFVGRRSVRLVGGHGGWHTPVPAQAYYDPAGVPVSHVLGDIAQACGESLSLASDSRPWLRYVREAMPGTRALNQILGQTWWVQNDGTTTNKARATGAITSAFQIEKFDGATGLFTIALDGSAIADWMPGRTFTSPTVTNVQTISSVTIVMAGPRVYLEVMSGTEDRQIADFLSLVRETMPSLTFLGTYEYSVRSDGGFDPVDPSIGLPSITNVELGLSLSTATLKAGDSVRVRFVDGRPWRPELASAPASSTAITIGNATPAAAARAGDPLQVGGSILGTVSGGACTITAKQFAAAFPTIKSGSTQVNLG
jgi:hypothetical protein